MRRLTIQMLIEKCSLLNQVTNSPLTRKDANGNYLEGHFRISSECNQTVLRRSTEGSSGYIVEAGTKKEIFNFMRAMISGAGVVVRQLSK